MEVRTVASVEERVIDIVCENLGVNKEQVNRQTSFQEDIGADSLEYLSIPGLMLGGCRPLAPSPAIPVGSRAPRACSRKFCARTAPSR